MERHIPSGFDKVVPDLPVKNILEFPAPEMKVAPNTRSTWTNPNRTAKTAKTREKNRAKAKRAKMARRANRGN